LRLGLLSTANINGAILAGAAATDAVDVVAVGSRDAARARRYADEHGIARAHGSYEDLLADDEVDAVYVSTPNALHVENAIQALEAGKHVLCEKPLARRAADAERAFDAAERAGRVLAEGFMYRHHPQMRRLGELLAEGALGEVRLVRAAFSFPLDKPGDPRWSRELEGGALMDVGCYCVNAVRFATGAEPERVHAEQVLGGEGVDARVAALLRFGGDAFAMIDCGFDVPAQAGLEIVGADATATMTDPWHGHTPGIELRRGDDVQTIATEPADPYRHELEDFAAAVGGAREPLLGRAESVAQARAIELIYAAADSA
jgi:predicted dehydrogenase